MKEKDRIAAGVIPVSRAFLGFPDTFQSLTHLQLGFSA
jgi:hypothetical protein